jgi:hypothetical protein
VRIWRAETTETRTRATLRLRAPPAVRLLKVHVVYEMKDRRTSAFRSSVAAAIAKEPHKNNGQIPRQCAIRKEIARWIRRTSGSARILYWLLCDMGAGS